MIRFFIPVIFFLVALSAFAQSSWRISEVDQTGFTLDWTSPAVKLRPVKRGGRFYTRVEMAGLTNGGSLGGPSLPSLSQWIAVPPGHAVGMADVTLEEVTKDCPNPVDFEGHPRTHCAPSRRAVTADPDRYDTPDAEAVELSPPSQAGALSLVKLTLTPVRRAATRKLSVMRHVRLRIGYRPLRADEEGGSSGWISQSEQNFFRGLVLNPEAVPDAVRSDRRVDLVIAPAKFASALEPLIRFKESQGREVRLRTVKEKTSTAAIQQIIAKEYGAGVTPSHTLIVGSLDDVPSFKKKDDYWSDYPYTLLDDGNLPDLSLGRLPARTPEELGALVDKIVRRETEPRDDTTVVLTSGEEVNWCQVNLNYIRDHILRRGLIPLEITKLYSTEGATTEKVVAAYNANPNLILYDGHGNSSGMIEIPLVIKHLAQLKNTAFPLIFDIACLNAYWPTTGTKTKNFADSVALLKQSGAAGILASSSFSGGHELFRYLFRASVFDELDTAAPYHNLHEVGDAIRFAKTKYLAGGGDNAQTIADNEMFYYLGDPASTIFHTPVVPYEQNDEAALEQPLELDRHPEGGEQ